MNTGIHGWILRPSAAQREALKQGLSLRTEEQMERALYNESLESQYGEDPHVLWGKFGEWGPQKLVRVGHPGRDGNCVPTIDDDMDGDPHVAPRSYPAWKDGETFVVSGPLGDYGNDFSRLGRGRPFHTRKAARQWAKEKYGFILEETLLKGRYCMRVPVPGGPHDPRTSPNAVKGAK